MKVSPSLRLVVERTEWGSVLEFSAAADLVAEDSFPELGEIDFDSLVELAAAPAALKPALQLGIRFCNGWQSWSFSGELEAGERPSRAALLNVLNTYTDRPGPLPGRGEILSHFFTYFRSGQSYLGLVSCGSPDALTPPLAFRIGRLGEAVSLEVEAPHARWTRGQLVARVALFYVEGYFAFKRRLSELFSGHRRLEALSAFMTEASSVPGGYETWYDRYLDIDEAQMNSELEAIDTTDNLINLLYLERGRHPVFQIDDGWERAVGDWTAAPHRFPGGMAALARAIEEKGMIPGIWIAPLVVAPNSLVHLEHPEWLLRDDG
ncbi:MAG TPA: alpha-galactosidase, partial [Rectinemataceae bacterium]|nr:alpha-galactosidase [Rectinemataceae bacterium]